MDTTNSSENQQRRVEDRKPAEVIDWAAPGAPAVPLSPAATSGTDEFMVYGRAGNRRADLEAKLRDALAASIPGSAATSGDAPDLQQLKALALAAGGRAWIDNGTMIQERREPGERPSNERRVWWHDFEGNTRPEHRAHVAAANPAVVLGLIARIDRAERALIRAGFVDHGAQEWKPPVGPAPRFIEVPADPATASGDELPPLPEPFMGIFIPCLFEAWQKQMRAYARAAVSAATKPTAELGTKLPKWIDDLKGYDSTMDAMIEYIIELQSLLATKPAAAPVDRASVLREVEAVIEQAISDMLTKKGQVAGATFCLDAIRAMLAAAPVRLPQRFTAGLPAEGQKTLEDAARKLVTYSHIYTGDKQARRLAVELSLMAEMMSRTPAASTTGAAQTAEQVRERQREECWSRDEEDFNHLSLSDLIDSHEDLKPGDTVWVGEAVHPEAAQMVNVDSILENIGEAAYDIGGEHAEDYPDVTAEQTKELEQLVVDWLNRSCNTSFWTVTNIKPYVLSADDFPTPTHSSEAGDA